MCSPDQDPSTGAQAVTAEDIQRGYVVCGCGKYAHILLSRGLREWPKDYHGELCTECGLWMAAMDKREPQE